MQINKVTEKYTFYKDGSDYILNLGAIKKNEDTTTELLFTDLESASKLVINSTCGCTVAHKEVIDNTTVKVKVRYNDCGASFSKILSCRDGKNDFKIKVKGTCH